jgi:serine/threonine-protein kinase
MAESKTKTLSSSGAAPFDASLLERGLAPATDALEDLDPRSVPAPGALIGDKYRVESLIARGGMGAVFLATHSVSGKRVALKWMLPALGQIKGARERFIREACATARIAHPNIVDIYDVGSEGGSVFLVMEYLRGETLSDRLMRTRMTATELIGLLMPALRAVAAAHSHGVVHRDLKPDNIFLCCSESGDDLEPKVLDFGISKFTSDEVRDLALTHSGAVLGTPYYMSPEQVRGAREVDGRTDVYAFGVIMFEALTGQRPFDAETYNELILKIATEPPPRAADLNPGLDPALVAVVERAMAREPRDRYPSIQALAAALEPFAGGVRFRSGRALSDRPPTSGDYPVGSIRVPSAPSVHRTPSLALSRGPQPAAREGARVSLAAAGLALAACALLAIYMLRGRTELHAALPAPAVLQPTAAAPVAPQDAPTEARPADLPLAAAPPPSIESQVLAANGKPARSASSANKPQPKRTAPARSELPAPPAPDTEAAAIQQALGKRASAKDWDERLDGLTPRTASPAEVPAGQIDARDFR